MASLQPVTQSYLEEPSSCFKQPQIKPYNKGSVMDILMQYSPLMAYFAQYALLDGMLDNLETRYTCFAPCKEYCEKYWHLFQGKIDHLKARNLVLSCVVKYKISEKELTHFDIIPSLNQYSNIDVRYLPLIKTIELNRSLMIIRGDIDCTNGVVHLINGLVEPTLPC